MRTLALLSGLAVALSGCATAPPRAPAGWTLQVSGSAGAALNLADAAGREALRIACRRNPTDLYVASDLAAPTTGAVALRVGERRFPLSPGDDEPRLSATAPPPGDLAAALMSGGRIALIHPGGETGPFTGPDPQDAAAFAIACRR